MTDKKPAQNPDFVAALGTLITIRSLDESRAAGLLGVPVFTLRKWLSGQRSPNAAAVRLVDVLTTLSALAPDVLSALELAADKGVVQAPSRKRKMKKDPL